MKNSKNPALKKQRELEKRLRQKQQSKSKWYIFYLIFIITLVYITDEIASQIGTLMKTEIATDMMASFGESSVGMLDILGFISIPFMAVAVLYKPLSDRFGRKPFLVINTLGMSLGMILIFLSRNIALYVIGYTVIQFFVPHDMQVVYIMESAPPKHRAKIYSAIKCAATLGVMLVPLLRRLLMAETSQWRKVYFVPALVGLAAGTVVLLLAKETDAFVDSRIRYLGLSQEQLELERQVKKADNAQGGLISAFRFVFAHKQLKWLFIAFALSNIGFLITADYQVIMSYGYASAQFGSGLFASLDEALKSVGVNEITSAAFFFPVGSAVIQLLMGFVADGKSRRAAALFTSAVSTAALVFMWVGAVKNLNPYFTGFFSGLCIGGFWALGDIIIMMIGESSPTNLRSSITSAGSVAMGLGCAVSYAVGVPLVYFLGNSSTGGVCLALAIPGAVLSFLALLFKTADTTGLDLDKVTGCEWD